MLSLVRDLKQVRVRTEPGSIVVIPTRTQLLLDKIRAESTSVRDHFHEIDLNNASMDSISVAERKHFSSGAEQELMAGLNWTDVTQKTFQQALVKNFYSGADVMLSFDLLNIIEEVLLFDRYLERYLGNMLAMVYEKFPPSYLEWARLYANVLMGDRGTVPIAISFGRNLLHHFPHGRVRTDLETIEGWYDEKPYEEKNASFVWLISLLMLVLVLVAVSVLIKQNRYKPSMRIGPSAV